MRVFRYSDEQLADYITKCVGTTGIEVDKTKLINFLFEDVSKERGLDSPSQYEGVVGDRFINISDIGIDFLFFILGSGMAEFVTAIVTKADPLAANVAFGVCVASFIREELKKVIKLRGEEYCIYKQAMLHANQDEEFTIEEMFEWLPDYQNECNSPNKRIFCRYRKHGYNLSDNEDKVLDVLYAMAEKDILSDIGGNVFRLNH